MEGDFIDFLVLCGVCITGAWLGLAISAIFTSEKAAVAMLPIVLVPVLLFSGTIVGDVYEPENGIFNESAAHIEKMMPCHTPAMYLKYRSEWKLNRKPKNGEKEEEAKKNMMKTADDLRKSGGMTLIIVLGILAAMQYIQEKKWEGR